MGKIFTFLLLSACTLGSLQLLAQPPEAFRLNGNNYILGHDPIDASGEFTVEFWAYVPAGDGKAHQLIAEGSPGATFYVGYDANGIINIGDLWGPTGVQMPFGTWTHFAVTFDDNSFATTLYINGVQTAMSYDFAFADGNPLTVGTSADLTALRFTGEMQNVAVYSLPRSASQIKADMFSTNFSDATLTMFYRMNDPSGTTVTNGALSGNSQDGVIYGDDGSNSYIASPIQYSSNALTFDGANDTVYIPANAAYDLSTSTGGTIEFWVNPATLSSSFATILGNRGPDPGGGVRYSIHLSATQVGLDVGTGQVNAINLPDTLTPTGVWHHMAFVNTGSATNVYINGNLLGPIPGSFNTVTGQPLVFGQALAPTAGANETAFNGSLDEIRIWNTQRSPADILANMNNTLTGTEPGLVAEFGFDEGVPGGDNTGLTTTLDNSTVANNGTLKSFTLSGPASNFSLHTLTSVPLPLTLTRFTANRDDDESLLQWETGMEQNTLDFIVERSSDGQHYSTIGTVDAAGNSTIARNYEFTDRTPRPNANFYRLKLTDIDGQYTYSPVCVVNYPVANRLFWYATGPGSATVSLSQGNNEFYSLADASGRLIRLGQLSGGKTQFAGLPAGIYFVRIGSLVTKIIL